MLKDQIQKECLESEWLEHCEVFHDAVICTVSYTLEKVAEALEAKKTSDFNSIGLHIEANVKNNLLNEIINMLGDEVCVDEGCPHHGTEHICRNVDTLEGQTFKRGDRVRVRTSRA